MKQSTQKLVQAMGLKLAGEVPKLDTGDWSPELFDETYNAYAEGGLNKLSHDQFVKELEHMFAIESEEAEDLAQRVEVEFEALNSDL